MVQQKHGRFRFGSPSPLPAAAYPVWTAALSQTNARAERPLDGRGSLHVVDTPELGRVFVKHYLRGGALRYINDRQHLRSSRSRGQRELENILSLQGSGIALPEPLAWAETGMVFTNCWLLMRELPAQRPLTHLVRHEPAAARALLPTVVAQVATLVRRGFHHVDLHPGNVLVAEADDATTIIDFDKGHYRSDSPAQLAERYIRRWCRAIERHGLPAEFAEDFTTRLRSQLSDA